MQHRFTAAIVLIASTILAIWMTIEASFLPAWQQGYILATIAVIGVLGFLYKKIPFDYKLICMLIMGYAFAGKGFAYITPFEPVYIGEIVWILGMFGYLYRISSGTPLLPTRIHVMILLWMITVGLYLLHGFPIYRTLSVRDSVIGYYAMFAFFGYAIFMRTDLSRSFGWVLKASVAAGALGLFTMISGIYQKISGSQSVISYYFHPHDDAFLQLVAGGAVYCLLEGIRLKRILTIGIGIGLAMLICLTKTAGIFCLFVTLAYMFFIGRRSELVVTGTIVSFLAAVVILAVISIDSTNINMWIQNNDHIQTFNLTRKTGVANESTTAWRLDWWKMIYEDTIKTSPLVGAGLGGDISTTFIRDYLRMDLNSLEAVNYSRYPHNVIFTVFGRMGFIGLLVFFALLASIIRMLIKTTHIQIHDNTVAGKTALLSLLIVVAGIANSVVQATYEVPHGAIIHWICIGYVLTYYTKMTAQAKQARVAPPSTGV